MTGGLGLGLHLELGKLGNEEREGRVIITKYIHTRFLSHLQFGIQLLSLFHFHLPLDNSGSFSITS